MRDFQQPPTAVSDESAKQTSKVRKLRHTSLKRAPGCHSYYLLSVFNSGIS